MAAMHAGYLSDKKGVGLSVEIFKEERTFNCRPDNDIRCIQNGIVSRTKKGKLGYRFVDSANSCKF